MRLDSSEARHFGSCSASSRQQVLARQASSMLLWRSCGSLEAAQAASMQMLQGCNFHRSPPAIRRLNNSRSKVFLLVWAGRIRPSFESDDFRGAAAPLPTNVSQKRKRSICPTPAPLGLPKKSLSKIGVGQQPDKAPCGPPSLRGPQTPEIAPSEVRGPFRCSMESQGQGAVLDGPETVYLQGIVGRAWSLCPAMTCP